MLQLKIGANGGLILNEEFMVNFGAANLPNGPYLAREMRFPNGDCTSDSYM
jgi:selenium-binding protein 1